MSIIKSILSPILGKRIFQTSFRLLHQLSLSGMHYGAGGNIQKSGELHLLNNLKKKWISDKVNDLIIFDVGANKGSYAIALLEIFKDFNIQIHAFEPSKDTFKLLETELGGIKSMILNSVGCGKEQGVLKIYSTTDSTSGWASLYDRKLDHHGAKMQEIGEVEIVSIDSYCKNKNITHIHFLKLDIEGHELPALEGASDMLQNTAIDYIQFEFGGCNIDSRTYFQDFFYLLEKKYQLYRIVKDGLYPISQYSEVQEIFMNINYLAIRK